MPMPGLWIWGDRDGSVPVRESKAILESITKAYDKEFTIFYHPTMGHDVVVPLGDVASWIYAQLEE
jgi:pimeloyl-ACP methyl ester carboxylesterase